MSENARFSVKNWKASSFDLHQVGRVGSTDSVVQTLYARSIHRVWVPDLHCRPHSKPLGNASEFERPNKLLLTLVSHSAAAYQFTDDFKVRGGQRLRSEVERGQFGVSIGDSFQLWRFDQFELPDWLPTVADQATDRNRTLTCLLRMQRNCRCSVRGRRPGCRPDCKWGQSMAFLIDCYGELSIGKGVEGGQCS